MAVIHAEIMTSTDQEATDYLKDSHIKMALRTYREHKKKIHADDTLRLYELAKAGKENQMGIIREYKTIKAQFWKMYRKETDPNVRLRALRQVREVLPFITAAEAAVPFVIKEVIQNFGKDASPDGHPTASGAAKKQGNSESAQGK